MRIIVTGGAGFIGSHVAEVFLANGHEVAVVDDLSTGHRHNVPARAHLYECDIRSQRLAEIFTEFQPEVIAHHAAQMSVRVSIQEPRRDADINVEGSINVLECARAAGVRKVLYASTGGALYGEPQYVPCDEAHRVMPLCHYGISKHTVEHYLELYASLYDMDFTVLRYPNVYGPRQDPEGEAGVVAIFTGRMLDGLPVTIFGDGAQQRDFVYVADVAAANLRALEQGSRTIINLGSGAGVSVLDIFHALADIIQYNLPPCFAQARLGEVYRIFLTGDRADQLLGWAPRVSLMAGLRRTVAWTRETRMVASITRSAAAAD